MLPLSFTTAEQLLYSTVNITSIKDGVPVSTGTGFFMQFAVDGDRHIPAIVTNKHVLDGSDHVLAVCHIGADGKASRPSGKFATCLIQTSYERRIDHPDDETDLCVLPIGDILQMAETNGEPLFLKWLSLDMIPLASDWQYFDAIEDVTMIGCPNGIYDAANNLPIVRRGITASPLSRDYNGKMEFMVDMACFPGSSGSPILVYDRDGYLDRKNNKYVVGQTRLHLVGILYAGPEISNTGQVILAQPPKVAVASMMHLGNAVKATALHALDEEIRKRLL